MAEYSRCLPNATGFLNGYGPSFTASPNNGNVFLSFDYYLDEERPTEAVQILPNSRYLARDHSHSLMAYRVFG